MGFISLLACRFLTGGKGFLSFISAFSLFGVALGVAAMVVVMAVLDGFQEKLHELITSNHSHILLYSLTKNIQDSKAIEKKLKDLFPEEIEASSSFIFSEVMLIHKGRVLGSLLEGIDRESSVRTTDILKKINNKKQGGLFRSQTSQSTTQSTGNSKLPPIVLGSVLLEQLGASPGDTISVMAPFLKKWGIVPRSQRFYVAGVLSTGMYEYDSKYSLMEKKNSIEFLGLPPNSASALRIKTKDPKTSHELSKKIKQVMGYSYSVRDWTQLNQNLLYAIKLQKIIIFIVLVSIILVAAFNIMSTLVIMTDEKKREMAILSAIGLLPRHATYIFMIIGGIIALSGSAAGVALGLGIAQFLAKTSFITLPPDIYFISYLPVNIHPATVGLVVGIAIVTALLATIYPSIRVARKSPIEVLRYE